ncbi:MAG: hypothetical protein AAFX10_17285, partial [Pseudomonadota bacterium]
LSRSFLASVIFLGAAINVDANPREAKVDPEAQAEDTLPVVIEIPSHALTLDTAPVIEIDDIAALEMPGEDTAVMPAPQALDAADTDADSSQDAAWTIEPIDISIEALELELRQSDDDDLTLKEPAPRIELQMPAPEITLDF